MDKPKEKSKEVFVKTTNISEQARTDKIKERLDTQKEKRRIAEKFKKVKHLIDSDEEEDAADWYYRTKNFPKTNESSNKRLKSSETDKKKQYTQNDLKGLAIGHKSDVFQEGHQVILTLRDKDVLDEEDEDVLENVNIVDDEKAAKNIENKTKRPDYKPFDDDEFDEFNSMKKPSLLNKYDEEIEGPKVNMFRIGSNSHKNDVKNILDPNKISLDFPEFKIANEYYTEEEMLKFKKPSKRKNASRKKNLMTKTNYNFLEELSTNNEEIMPKKSKEKKSLDLDIDNIDENLVGPDDDLSGIIIDDEAENELQSVLHKARNIKLKAKFNDPVVNIANIVDKLNTEKPKTVIKINKTDKDDKIIILNSTEEFSKNVGKQSINPLMMNENHISINNVIMKEEEEEDMENDIKMEKMDDDDSNDNSIYLNNWNEVDVKNEEYEEPFDDEPRTFQSQPILEEEPDVSVGVAGALKLAMTKGYLDKEATKSFGATRSTSIIAAQSYEIENKFQ